MNDELHIDENIQEADKALPNSLTVDELSTIARVGDTYRRLMKVNCTGCRYCMPCPAGVDIPGCFSLYNANHLFPHDLSAKFWYIGRHGGLLSRGGVTSIRPWSMDCPGTRLRAYLYGMMSVSLAVGTRAKKAYTESVLPSLSS